MKLFKSYKAEFDMACKVMKSMAEEIIKLREEIEMQNDVIKELRNANRAYKDENVKAYNGVRKAQAALDEIKK